jgi:hypothetical protein
MAQQPNPNAVTDEDIQNAMSVIGQWTAAVLTELAIQAKTGQASDKKKLTKSPELNTDGSKIASQISALGAGIGRSC